MKFKDKGVTLTLDDWKEIAGIARAQAEEEEIIDNHDPEEVPYSVFDITYEKDNHEILFHCQGYYNIEKSDGATMLGTTEKLMKAEVNRVVIEDIVIDGESVDYNEYKDNEFL